jgi:APA family basic amino acid/polyamine antiporter
MVTPPGKSGTSVAAGTLRRAVGGAGYFALAFGAIVGSGWVVVLGDWLNAAGPGGATVAILAGGVVMLFVALCYGELAARFPSAGAEFLYVLRTLGRLPGFLVGWYLTLYAVAVCAFEAVALDWILRTLFPRIELRVAYHVGASAVTWDALIIAVVGALVIGGVHWRGAVHAIRFQNVVTYGFIAVSGSLIAVALWCGDFRNLQPLFASADERSWTRGALWIFATCAFFLNGWQTALHAIEERRADVSPRTAVLSMMAAVFAAALFYAGMVLAAGSAVAWRHLVGKDLPAVAAFRALGAGGIFGTLILAAAAISIAKAWSAMVWVGSRLLFAQARQGLLPQSMATADPVSGAPRAGVLLVTVLSVAGAALGRAAILPIVNMVSTCVALSMVLCLIALLRSRTRTEAAVSFTVPGGVPVIACAVVGATAMIGMALAEPWINQRGSVPPEWILLAAWGGVGLLVWGQGLRRRRG